MRLCLTSKPSSLQRAALFAALAAFADLVACSDPFTASSGSAGSGGSLGPAGAAGAAGESTAGGGADYGGDSNAAAGDVSSDAGAPSAGMSGASDGGVSSAGTGGKAPAGCDCAVGTYCQDGTTTCNACSNFARLHFATPQKLATLGHAAQSTERFPRQAGTGSALFYTEGDPGKERIWYAPAPLSGIGSAIGTAGRVETGALLAPGFVQQNFFFDSVDSSTGERKIMAADYASGAVKDPTPLAAPYNLPGGDDYSVAVAPSAARVYWMSTRSGKPELYTYSNSATIPLPPVVVELQVRVGTAGKTCPRSGDDATPWVNLKGTLLLFRSQSVDENCALNDSGAYNLFAVPLASADGMPVGAAVPLPSLNTTGGKSNETDPSFSLDACTIYYASDSGTGDYELYRAPRD